MGDPEKGFSEKERISAEMIRDGPAAPTLPVLPTANPEIEKKEVPASQLHPAFYVMWVPLTWQRGGHAQFYKAKSSDTHYSIAEHGSP